MLKKRSWLLLVLLLIPYLFLKFQAMSYARQAAGMEIELEKLRPAVSARVLSEQLENTLKACEEVSGQVRRLDLKNGELLAQFSKLPASITLERVENRSRLKTPLQSVFSGEEDRPQPELQASLRIQGVLAAGIRDPESVLARWAQSLQGDSMSVHLRRLFPSPLDQNLWVFELYLEGA